MTDARPFRIAVYTHDTFGLGHVRRCLHIVRALASREPESAILFVTGCPALHVLDGLPPNADYVKIPTIAKTGAEHLRPPHLHLPLPEVAALRERVIRETVLAFDPDVLLVDNFPLGSGHELLATLRALRRPPARTVLGLRDILDAPDVVRGQWARQGIYDVLDRYYDRILVYGVRGVLDVAEAYDLAPRVAAKVRYCGYVTAPPPEAAALARADLGLPGPFLLATGGGGGDAYPLLGAFLRALPLLPSLPVVVVTGPLMSPSLRTELRGLVNGRADVVIRDYVPDLRPYLAAAAAVVAMAGYNTAAEIAALGARAVLVPRTWRYGEHLQRDAAGEEREQLMRARALEAVGAVEVLPPHVLTPERLAERIAAVLARPAGHPAGLDFGGVDAVRDELLALATAAREGPR